MEQIIINLKDPSWWFTGIFFLVIGILLAKVLTTWIPSIWECVTMLVPKITSRIQRWKERKILIRVKHHRQYQIKVNWLISRYWSLLTVFSVFLVLLVVLFSLSNEIADKSIKIRKLFPLVLPIYAFQIFIIWEKIVLMRVMRAHINWLKRTTIRSNKDALSRTTSSFPSHSLGMHTCKTEAKAIN